MLHHYLSKVLKTVQKGIFFAAKHPFMALTTLLYFQSQLSQAETIYRDITCPEANSIADEINRGLNWVDCRWTYPTVGTGIESYTISRNPDEVFYGYIKLNTNCTIQPNIQLANNADLAVMNVADPNTFFNETGHTQKNLSFIDCRYPILASSLSVNYSSCGTFYEPSECYLFPQNNHYFQISALLTNSICYTDNSTFSCMTNITASPLNGVWQLEQHQYPIFSYSNLDNTLFLAHEVNIPGQGISCVISHFANATDYHVIDVPFYRNGTYVYEQVNNTFEINYRDNENDVTVITKTPACLAYFKSHPDYMYFYGFGLTILNNNTLSIKPYGDYSINSYNGTYLRIKAGSLFFLDNLNSSYGFSSNFNVTQAKVAAESVNNQCNLHLTPASTHAPQAFFKFNATDNSQIFPQEIEIDFYTNISSKILNCVENALLMFVGNNQLSSSSSSTGASSFSSLVSSSSNELFSSSIQTSSPSSTATTITSTALTSSSSSESQSSGANNSANAASESQPSLWTSPVPYLVAAGTVLTSLAAYLTYKRCRANKSKIAEENIELLPTGQPIVSFRSV